VSLTTPRRRSGCRWWTCSAIRNPGTPRSFT